MLFCFFFIQLDASKKELEVHIASLEEAEAARQKQKRENEELRAEVEKYQADVQRMDKARKKLQGELEDVTVSMERERQNAAAMATKQKKFDSQLNDERANLQAVMQERDNVEKQARANETKVLSLQNTNAELEDRLVEVSSILLSVDLIIIRYNGQARS